MRRHMLPGFFPPPPTQEILLQVEDMLSSINRAVIRDLTTLLQFDEQAGRAPESDDFSP